MHQHLAPGRADQGERRASHAARFRYGIDASECLNLIVRAPARVGCNVRMAGQVPVGVAAPVADTVLLQLRQGRTLHSNVSY